MTVRTPSDCNINLLCMSARYAACIDSPQFATVLFVVNCDGRTGSRHSQTASAVQDSLVEGS